MAILSRVKLKQMFRFRVYSQLIPVAITQMYHSHFGKKWIETTFSHAIIKPTSNDYVKHNL